MAIAMVQKYLDLALSAAVGNKSGTDNFLRLPDDIRKLTNLKVKNFWVETGTIGFWDGSAGLPTATPISVNGGNSSGFILVYFSIPVEVTHVNAVAMTSAAISTSFYGTYRDRAGDHQVVTGTSASWLSFMNVLSTSSAYTDRITGAGQGVDVDYYSLEIEFE